MSTNLPSKKQIKNFCEFFSFGHSGLHLTNEELLDVLRVGTMLEMFLKNMTGFYLAFKVLNDKLEPARRLAQARMLEMSFIGKDKDMKFALDELMYPDYDLKD